MLFREQERRLAKLPVGRDWYLTGQEDMDGGVESPSYAGRHSDGPMRRRRGMLAEEEEEGAAVAEAGVQSNDGNVMRDPLPAPAGVEKWKEVEQRRQERKRGGRQRARGRVSRDRRGDYGSGYEQLMEEMAKVKRERRARREPPVRPRRDGGGEGEEGDDRSSNAASPGENRGQKPQPLAQQSPKHGVTQAGLNSLRLFFDDAGENGEGGEDGGPGAGVPQGIVRGGADLFSFQPPVVGQKGHKAGTGGGTAGDRNRMIEVDAHILCTPALVDVSGDGFEDLLVISPCPLWPIELFHCLLFDCPFQSLRGPSWIGLCCFFRVFRCIFFYSFF